jgi:hypothetical protein
VERTGWPSIRTVPGSGTPFCFITGTNRHLPATLIYFFRFVLMLFVLSIMVPRAAESGETGQFACSKTRIWIVNWIVNSNCCCKLLIVNGGSSSVAERQLPKLNVAGSIPVSRSNIISIMISAC